MDLLMKARFFRHNLIFRFPAGTSRAVLTEKPTWYLVLEAAGVQAIGECSIIEGLSIDDSAQIEVKLNELCHAINCGADYKDIDLRKFPAIAFALETALLDWKAGGSKQLFASDFTSGKKGIAMNGLIWMGERHFMEKQINEKLAAGFDCIKIKVGAIDFETEIDILSNIRKKYSTERLEIRLDANGAFSANEAMQKLDRLSHFGIHSIEQPIKQGQIDAMAHLCRNSPIAIALDEELIAPVVADKQVLLEKIKPQYIILKPSLLGGLAVADAWINAAEKCAIEWWATSALESNIGLNAIAQWTYTHAPTLPQGLGTGQLYSNNIASPLVVRNASLWYDVEEKWEKFEAPQPPQGGVWSA